MPPALLGAIVLLATIGLIGTDSYLYVRYVISVLALIVVVTTIQYRKWWWGLPMLPLVVLWNPAWPFEFGGDAWQVLILIGSAVFIAAGILFRTADTSKPVSARSVR
ncbi:DUF6804 family protein [Mycetocola zhadangensis]|jgi:amino acid transporter|uniref:DUF6804 family protein n=1 Tax=Mycetocola zhadangensis TaxID=1164595 RepID=UPI003A4D6DB4